MKIKINFKRFSLFLIAVFTIYIGIMHYKATVDNINIKNEQDTYLALIEEEKAKNEKLKETEENLNTTESYEQIARENLGLLKSDETVYVNSDSN